MRVKMKLILFLLMLLMIRANFMEVDWLRDQLWATSHVDTTDDTFHREWHPAKRSERFPSVEERVKLYMSSLYLPPCPNTTRLDYEVIKDNFPVLVVRSADSNTTIPGLVDHDRDLLLQRDVMRDCASSKVTHEITRFVGLATKTKRRVHFRRNMRPYCRDIADIFRIADANPPAAPLVALFGDGISTTGLPVIGKWRWALSKEAIANITKGTCANVADLQKDKKSPLPPVLWKLETNRHFEPLGRVPKADIPWNEKEAKAVWRGSFTGTGQGHTVGSNLTERCFSNDRCQFVYNNAKSRLVDAAFVHPQQEIGDTIEGLQITGKGMPQRELLRFKIIVSMEGNDVASGLKWNLFSKSVVLMPPPTKTTWAMEELLEPWIHYIPMARDGSNAEERVQWVLDNDKEAQRIAERSTLFMHDLLYHPDAKKDEREVKQEIVRRYQRHWY